MTDGRTEQIAEEERVGEDALRAEDAKPSEPSRFLQLHPRDEVHPLVLSLLQERVHVATVSAKESE